MPKLLLNCDQVFDVLTRGPFPAGESSDEAVEQHLRACHNCRSLAEALRPAVSLLHEAIASSDACGLPEYQGTLSERGSVTLSGRAPRALPRGMRKLAQSASSAAPHSRMESVLMAVRLAAATVLVAALGVLLYGFSSGTTSSRSMPIVLERSSPVFATETAPTPEGLLQLAALRLPAACFTKDQRPNSMQQAELLLAAMEGGTLEALHCCTECHHAASALRGVAAVASLRQHCSICHRG